jgi:tetratricopeptide (TPR) repeat protein
MGLARWAIAAALLAAATCWVNAPALNYGFVYDDHAVIVEREPYWNEGLEHFLRTRHWGVGRQAVLATLDLDRRDPLSPRPFHRTNILMAAVVVVLVHLLGLSLGMGELGAFAGALLFAWHPLHVDAVVGIVGRAEIQAALGVLVCLLLHVRGYPPGGLGLLAAGLAFLFALASKESAACLLVLIPLYDLFLGGSRRLTERIAAYATYLLALAAWLVVAVPLLGSVDPIAFVDNPIAHLGALQRIPAAAAVLWSYARLAVVPIGLLPDRSYAVTAAPHLAVGWLSIAAWLAVGAVCLAMRRRAAIPAFLVSWFPAAFIVTANVVFPIGTIMSERLTYLPTVGPCLLGGLVVERVARGTRLRQALACTVFALAAVALFFGYRQRASVWQSNEVYHLAAVAAAPRSAKTHYNLGLVRGRQHRLEDAAAAFEQALAIHPGFTRAAHYLAAIELKLGRPGDAAATYRAYLKAKPDDGVALLRLGRIEIELGEPERALATARRLIAIDPTDADYRDLLTRAEGLARRARVSP